MAGKTSKVSEVKFPHSAALFQLCRRILDHKLGGIRVIDQDVGQILGFDPADCSHWKKGKKNIRSIYAMKSIAEHLGVDERLVVEVAAGDMNDTEAFYEYLGYGNYGLDTKLLESAKKDYYRKNASKWNKEKEDALKAYFQPNMELIDEMVASVQKEINFEEAPLYLPEVFNAYKDLELAAGDEKELGDSPVDSVRGGGKTKVRYAGNEMRPYMRFRIAKEVAKHFMIKNNPELYDIAKVPAEISQYVERGLDVQFNIFAAKLLVPAKLVRKELNNIDISKDIVTQLAETFWVSKKFMNARLREILAQS